MGEGWADLFCARRKQSKPLELTRSLVFFGFFFKDKYKQQKMKVESMLVWGFFLFRSSRVSQPPQKIRLMHHSFCCQTGFFLFITVPPKQTMTYFSFCTDYFVTCSEIKRTDLTPTGIFFKKKKRTRIPASDMSSSVIIDLNLISPVWNQTEPGCRRACHDWFLLCLKHGAVRSSR